MARMSRKMLEKSLEKKPQLFEEQTETVDELGVPMPQPTESKGGRKFSNIVKDFGPGAMLALAGGLPMALPGLLVGMMRRGQRLRGEEMAGQEAYEADRKEAMDQQRFEQKLAADKERQRRQLGLAYSRLDQRKREFENRKARQLFEDIGKLTKDVKETTPEDQYFGMQREYQQLLYDKDRGGLTGDQWERLQQLERQIKPMETIQDLFLDPRRMRAMQE